MANKAISSCLMPETLKITAPTIETVYAKNAVFFIAS
jgi:hypothetical protein